MHVPAVLVLGLYGECLLDWLIRLLGTRDEVGVAWPIVTVQRQLFELRLTELAVDLDDVRLHVGILISDMKYE